MPIIEMPAYKNFGFLIVKQNKEGLYAEMINLFPTMGSRVFFSSVEEGEKVILVEPVIY